MAFTSDPDFELWTQKARTMRVDHYLRAKGLWTQAMAGDNGVPCPACGGRDRFAINIRKNRWLCRASGTGGGALSLWAHLHGIDGKLRGQDFLDACEDITGDPRPERPEDRKETPEERAAREAERSERTGVQAEDIALKASQADADARKFREWERRRAFKIWRDLSVPLDSAEPCAAAVRNYFEARGIADALSARGAHLRAAMLDYYHVAGGAARGDSLGRFPALVAAIDGPAVVNGRRRFGGAHLTYLQPDGCGKLQIADPVTGEILPAKKIRGGWRGGAITLARSPERATRMIAGEGIETVYSAWCALTRAGSPLLRDSVFVSFAALMNFAGKAAGFERHPVLTVADKKGRLRPLKIANAEPKWPDEMQPVIIPPSISELIWLGDGDSEEVFTRNAVLRGAERYCRHYPWLTVSCFWADRGADVNDMWKSALASPDERSAALPSSASPVRDDGGELGAESRGDAQNEVAA